MLSILDTPYKDRMSEHDEGTPTYGGMKIFRRRPLMMTRSSIRVPDGRPVLFS